MKIKIPSATTKQQEYIEQLCIDLNLSDRARRNAHISSILEREIKYLDELTIVEASTIIDKLRAWKYGEEV